MSTRPQEELVALGNYVAQLFEQEHFNTLIEEFNRQSVEHMLRTKPHEVKAREGVYAEITGVRALLDMMKQYIDLRDEILDKPTADEHHPDGRDYE